MSDDVTLQDIESPMRTLVLGSNVIESMTGEVLTTEILSMTESEAPSESKTLTLHDRKSPFCTVEGESCRDSLVPKRSPF